MTRHVREPLPPPKLSDLGTPRFKWEKFRAISRELLPLWQRHWEEIAQDRDSVPLDPDFDNYYRLDLEGILHILTVRVDGELAGYTFSLIGPHLHYHSTKTAQTEMFWLAPEHRSGWTGVRLLRLTRRGLRDRGVKLHLINFKIGFESGRVGKLLSRLGYRPTDIVVRQVIC